jgi:hypothetical protein
MSNARRKTFSSFPPIADQVEAGDAVRPAGNRLAVDDWLRNAVMVGG